MADKEPQVIRIDSILGGHGPLSHFSAQGQFRASLGIDPLLGVSDTFDGNSSISSGLIRPAHTQFLGLTNGAPKWAVGQPKLSVFAYIYDSVGSVYVDDSSGPSGLSDLNDGGTASGNGAAYYDNYMYFARDTTIARYGPLNGAAVFTDDYWVGSLAQSALTNTAYPTHQESGVSYPNHVLHRHSDGRMYIADVVNNMGTLHYLETYQVTGEGESTLALGWDAVHVGFGLYPTAIESYGGDLAIAFIETAGLLEPRAKIAFWDTTSENVNKITWVEFPDPIISAMKNINGVLYVFSGAQGDYESGFRVSRFVGGYTFEEVVPYSPANGEPPLAGAVDGIPSRIWIGSYTNTPEQSPCVFSIDLQGPTNGIFNVMRSTASTVATAGSVTALRLLFQDPRRPAPYVGWSVQGGRKGLDVQHVNDASYDYSLAPSMWWSPMYRIGQPFKITKIRIPLGQAIGANQTITAKIYTDDGAGTTYTLTAINNTNDPGVFNVIRRSDSNNGTIFGQHNFWLELRWTGSALSVVGLPIVIEYEPLND